MLEGRPIQAQSSSMRSNVVVRYVRQRRKTLTGAGLATAATLLLMIGVLGAWHYYADWRLGRIVLTTDGPPLAAEVLPASSGDQPIGEPFDIGTRTVLALPAGDYRLRVKAAGLMGQTYRVAVNRGETRTHHLTLDENRLLGERVHPVLTGHRNRHAQAGQGRLHRVEWRNPDSSRRIDGQTDLGRCAARAAVEPPSATRSPRCTGCPISAIEKRPGELVQPAPDLDGDGTGDLVWAIHGTPSLLALSGKDGSVLWAYSADPGPSATPLSAEEPPYPGRIAGAPAAVDVDGDGITDLVAEFVVLDDPKGLVTPPDAWPGRGKRRREDLRGSATSSRPCRAGRGRSSGVT